MEQGKKNMNKVWKIILQVLCILFALAMAVQIVFSFIWMAQNIDNLSAFGDTADYVSLSETLALDEYRPILYPLFLRFIRSIDQEHYFTIVFVIQTVISILSLSFAIYAIDTVCTGKRFSIKRAIIWLFCGLWLNAIPMITFMNFSVLTDSLANSFLVLELAIATLILYHKKPTIADGIGLAVAFIAQSLLRADRFYSGLLILLILFLAAIVRNKEWRKRMAIGMAALLAVCVGTTLIIRNTTQETGRGGRVQTNLSFVLLDRVVWPNMSANYDLFPEEIKQNISIEEANKFDSHNNQVMYFLAPTLEERVGKEKAEEYYRTMSDIVWKNMSGKVISDIFQDYMTVVITPLTHYRATHGLPTRPTNIGWNMHCLSLKTPELTKQYDDISFWILAAGVCLGLILLIASLIQKEKRPYPIFPWILAGIIISLWFTLGDGAPPNDRYYLIIYLVYAVIPIIGYFRLLNKNSKRLE